MSGDVQAANCEGHLLVVWRDSAGVAAALDGRRIAVSPSTRSTPAVACGRGSWLVVWSDAEGFGVLGRRVGIDGVLLDPAPLPIFRGPFGASEVAIAYGDGLFLVGWTDGVTTRALRVNDAAQVIDAAPIGAGLSGNFLSPRIVWTGSTFFLAWSEMRSSNPGLNPPATRIWGTRVSLQGVVDSVALPMIEAGAGLWGMQLSLTASGSRLTVAWVGDHGTAQNPVTCVDVAQVTDRRAQLVAPKRIRCSGDASGAGTPVLDETEIRWSRGEHVLVWRELMPDFSSVLRVARLDENVVPKDEPPYALLSRRKSSAWAPGLAITADGVSAVYYSAFDVPNEATVGVFLRTVLQSAVPPRRRAVGR